MAVRRLRCAVLEREERHWTVDGKGAGLCDLEFQIRRKLIVSAPGKISEIGIAGDLPYFGVSHELGTWNRNARCHE